MTYEEYTLDLLAARKHGEPIYLKRIAEDLATAFGIPLMRACAATATAIKRLISSGRAPDLRRWDRGIYWRTIQTPLGETPIDRRQIIHDRYLASGGYETGPHVLNILGLSDWVSKDRFFVSNAVKGRQRHDKRLHIVVQPPKTTITLENWRILQLLDVFAMLDRAPVNVDNPYKMLDSYIEKCELKYKDLLNYADRFYNDRIICHIAHTASLKKKEI